MELNNKIVEGAPRPAASIIILRDGGAGLEVFLIKRHDLSNAFGGAYVFPGGKVDALDAHPGLAAHLDQSAADLQPLLNEQDLDGPTAAGLYVAALREVFEESGILFAQDADPALIDQAAARLRGGETFNAMVQALDLRLLTRSLAPWSRWITPRMPSVSNKRFDTRFFVAAVPKGQTAAHDNHEATASVWLSPRTALEQYRDGDIMLAPPQIMTLAHLTRFADTASALGDARGRMPPAIEPEPFDLEGVRVICYPGDLRHPVRERAMPGPLRLHFREKRFLPVEGFEAFFV